MNSKDTTFSIRFAPERILQEAEDQMQKAFRNTCIGQIDSFFAENERYVGREFKKNPGAGLLLIREFLEKKFDDPKMQERMETCFEHNFERIMEESMQRAMQHKANAFVFAKAKEKS